MQERREVVPGRTERTRIARWHSGYKVRLVGGRWVEDRFGRRCGAVAHVDQVCWEVLQAVKDVRRVCQSVAEKSEGAEIACKQVSATYR